MFVSMWLTQLRSKEPFNSMSFRGTAKFKRWLTSASGRKQSLALSSQRVAEWRGSGCYATGAKPMTSGERHQSLLFWR